MPRIGTAAMMIVLIVGMGCDADDDGSKGKGEGKTQAEIARESPLSGESHAAFDTTLSGTRFKEVSHTFRLRNESGQAVEILKIGTTCGCTAGEASSKKVRPGEEVEIDATLAITGPGKKKELIKLVLDVGVVHPLVLEADVTITADIQPTRGAVRLDKTPRISLPILGITSGVTRPPSSPLLDAPDGVTCVFTGWHPRFPHVDADELDSGLWLGEIELERRPGWAVPPDTALHIEFDGWKKMQVGLTGRPSWLPWQDGQGIDQDAVRAGNS